MTYVNNLRARSYTITQIVRETITFSNTLFRYYHFHFEYDQSRINDPNFEENDQEVVDKILRAFRSFQTIITITGTRDLIDGEKEEIHSEIEVNT